MVALASRLVGNVRAVADTDSLMDAGMLLPILCLFKCTDNLQILRKRGIFQTTIWTPVSSQVEDLAKSGRMLHLPGHPNNSTPSLLFSHLRPLAVKLSSPSQNITESTL